MEDVYTINLNDLLRQQESLRQVIASISSELELPPLLTRIIRHACELLDVENGTIGLLDPDRKVIRTEAAHNMPPSEIGAELPAGVGVFGHIFLHQEPIIFGRYGDLGAPIHAELQDYTVLGVPISWHGRLIGVFGLGSPPPRKFTTHDVEVLALFSKHAAIAIENARRYERENRQTERLARIARIGHMLTADLNIDELIEHAATAIHELLGYPNVAIPLLDPEDSETLVLRIFGGHYRKLMNREYRLPIHSGIMGAAVRERKVQLVNDVHADPRHIPTPEAVGIVAELALPIMLGNRIYGVLNVESGSRFTEEDCIGLQVVADQLAVAIENARLFADTQRALGETQFLYATSRRISTAMDIDQVIDTYLEQVASQGHYACSIAIYETDETGRNAAMRVRGSWRWAQEISVQEWRLPYTFDALESSLNAGQTVTIRDIASDPRVSSELRDMYRRNRQQSLAMIPLMASEKCIGIVILSHSGAPEWREADLRSYQAAAAQLAMVLHSRSQYLLLAERGQQLAVLEERQRLARELHDSVTQLLFSITLIAQSLEPAWMRDRREGERRIERLLELSQNALAEMRALLSNLRPHETPSRPATPPRGILAVRQFGLSTALRLHAAGVAHDGIEISADTQDYSPQPLEYEETLFRITQEALNNIVKHAQAQKVEIRLRADDRRLYLSIQDDGVGFTTDIHPLDDAQAEAPKQMGLAIMRERAEAQGGGVRILSSPGGGTLVEVVLPIPK